MHELLHTPYIVPLGAFAVAIVAIVTGVWKRMKEEELRHDREMREKEMAHQVKLKQMELEQRKGVEPPSRG